MQSRKDLIMIQRIRNYLFPEIELNRAFREVVSKLNLKVSDLETDMKKCKGYYEKMQRL